MACGCGKKRMAQYSSRQAAQQASGETVVASVTEMSPETGQPIQPPSVHNGPRAAASRSVVR